MLLFSNPQPQISTFLGERIQASDFPSAVYVIAEKGEPVFSDALGHAVREPETHAASLSTIFDLASLTKPLVTGLLCARLFESGKLELDRPVADYLMEFRVADKKRITIRDLLRHTSGLPAWRPLYLLTGGDKTKTLSAIADEPLQYVPGDRVIYSDLGFIVLGFVLQQLTGTSLGDLARSEIFQPLQMQQTLFNPAAAARTGIAACETGNAYERDMCERDFPNQQYSGWREDVIWGEVHDGNAYFLGDSAGHAGLFANAVDTLQIANQFVRESSQLLSPETCRLFRTNMTRGLNESRSFAWQLASSPDSTAGSALPADAFGHTGFTGTSCWIDAERQRVFILLTNRTHSRKLPFAKINAVRREFHSIAVAVLDES